MSFIKDFLNKLCCKHDWECENEIRYYEFSFSNRPYKRVYLYKCKKCGKFKKITL